MCAIGDAPPKLLGGVHVFVCVGIHACKVAEGCIIRTGGVGVVGIYQAIPGIVGHHCALHTAWYHIIAAMPCSSAGHAAA